MKRYIPSLMWLAILVVIYFMNTSGASLCFFKFIGVDHCPGCGIGRAIHHTLHFHFSEASDYHILGIPSTIAIIWLIIKPLIIKHTPYEPTNIHDARTSG